MLEKLEREHKERLEKQQKQYEDYMKNLEAKMKQRFDEYLSTTNSLQESKSEILDESIHLRRAQYSAPIDLNPGRYRTSSSNYQYRPLAKDLNLSRSQSREDIST
jgi:t-SNARE complex subunit (syntaxin)